MKLGKVNELLIKAEVSDLTDEKKEEDLVEELVEEEENVSGADCVFTAKNLETALNTVIFKTGLSTMSTSVLFFLISLSKPSAVPSPADE